MGDKPCPDCGCFMEETEVPYFPDAEGNPTVYGLLSTCPCCGYEEETYDVE